MAELAESVRLGEALVDAAGEPSSRGDADVEAEGEVGVDAVLLGVLLWKELLWPYAACWRGKRREGAAGHGSALSSGGAALVASLPNTCAVKGVPRANIVCEALLALE